MIHCIEEIIISIARQDSKKKKMLNASFISMDSTVKRRILNERKYISLFNHCHILLILTYNINVDKPDTNIVCATFCTRKHFF